MFDSDLIVTFLFMALLFLRQVSILKQPNKINYAPLILGIGVISFTIHFIMHPEETDIIMLLRESFLPLLMAFFFFIVMNIMHQTQNTENERNKDEFIYGLVFELKALKEFMEIMESKMSTIKEGDTKVQTDVRDKFKQDFRVLDTILMNQNKVLDKFENTENWHRNVSKDFEQFKNVQLPELDNVIHKHIDILRIAEQDHYNQIRASLEKAVNSRCAITDDIEQLKAILNGMNTLSSNIAETITKQTLRQLSNVTQSFEAQMVALKGHTENVNTVLHEGESKVKAIREQSELVLKQIIFASSKMSELEKQNHGLQNVYAGVGDLVREIEKVKADYTKSQTQLSLIAKEMRFSEAEQMEALSKQINRLGQNLTQKIDDSLEKLHEHYHITSEDITESVKILSKKAQSQKGYTQYES